jgi:hypothetical protein
VPQVREQLLLQVHLEALEMAQDLQQDLGMAPALEMVQDLEMVLALEMV